MAFNRAGLFSDGANAGLPGTRSWAYITTDALTVVRAADYFLSAIQELSLGDYIRVIIVGGTITAPTSLTSVNHTYVNAKNTATPTIDVVDGVAVTGTDTD